MLINLEKILLKLNLLSTRRPKLKKICRSSFKSVSFEILLKTRKNPKSPRAGPGFPGRARAGIFWARPETSPARKSPGRPAGFLDFFLFFKRILNERISNETFSRFFLHLSSRLLRAAYPYLYAISDHKVGREPISKNLSGNLFT